MVNNITGDTMKLKELLVLNVCNIVLMSLVMLVFYYFGISSLGPDEIAIIMRLDNLMEYAVIIFLLTIFIVNLIYSLIYSRLGKSKYQIYYYFYGVFLTLLSYVLFLYNGVSLGVNDYLYVSVILLLNSLFISYTIDYKKKR